MTGIIIKGVGGLYSVRCESGIAECRARGLFRKKNIKPMIGDCVTVENESITKIKERKNFLIRPPVANVDNLVIVAAAASPSPDFRLIDKMIINAEIAGIKPIICVNKTDLAACAEICGVYSSAGYPTVAVSAEENSGIDALLPYLRGKTTAFSGLSGVGKSSILNILTGGNMQTGAVSEKLQRGRHTTRHVELFRVAEETYVADTPGFSSVELEKFAVIRKEELAGCFREFQPYVDQCRFGDCSHTGEKGCAVVEAVQRGEIARSRFESYCTLYEDAKKLNDWELPDYRQKG